MSESINQDLIIYQYIEDIINFYSQNSFENKKNILTINQLKLDFEEATNYLIQWSNIAIDDFVLLLNVINKNGIIKYTKQNDLFRKGFENNDFIESVELNFFKKEIITSNFKDLEIDYNIYQTLLGRAIIASISDYICYLHFIENNDEKAIQNLKNYFKEACIQQKSKNVHLEAIQKINNPEDEFPIQILVQGSDLQEKVWKELVKLPYKSIFTYLDIAKKIQLPKASRAIGTAIGKNPIAILIPCHRIIQSSGKIGEYLWGINRKKALLIYEFLNQKKS